MPIDISICVITYNHEDYIGETLQSINAQQFNGNIELIIGVDVSNDHTLSVVKECINKCKWPVKLLAHADRKGMFGNLDAVLKEAKGTYIAMLEGDDYWIDDYKLQKQFLYMQKHNSCVATGGNIHTRQNNTISKDRSFLMSMSRYYYLNDFIHANRVSFCTIMFRRENLDLEKFQQLKNSPHIDWPLYLMLISSKKESYIKVFSDVFSVYRLHAGGVYSGVDSEKRLNNLLKTMEVNQTVLAAHQTDFYKLYQLFIRKQNAGIVSVKDLLQHYGLKKQELLSFYVQVYGGKKIVKILTSNIRYSPLLVTSAMGRFYRRYVAGLFF